jgi:hypothetical protein
MVPVENCDHGQGIEGHFSIARIFWCLAGVVDEVTMDA